MKSMYMPDYRIQKILQDRSAELRKCSNRITSMWYFDDETNTIMICSNRPGLWIGKFGEDINNLKDSVNKVIDAINERQLESLPKRSHIDIAFQECNC